MSNSAHIMPGSDMHLPSHFPSSLMSNTSLNTPLGLALTMCLKPNEISRSVEVNGNAMHQTIGTVLPTQCKLSGQSVNWLPSMIKLSFSYIRTHACTALTLSEFYLQTHGSLKQPPLQSGVIVLRSVQLCREASSSPHHIPPHTCPHTPLSLVEAFSSSALAEKSSSITACTRTHTQKALVQDAW